MSTKGINLERVKVNNRATVLKLLNKSGAMSRKDLAAEIGLTAASLTIICTELIEEGILKELGEADEEEKRAGRKKILVNINHEYKDVVCISMESDETHVSVTNLGGKVLGEKTIATDSSVEPEVFLKELSDTVKNILWEANIPKDMILGVGVTVPGMVDEESGVAVCAYGIWDKPVDIASILKKELGFKIIVENNLKAYAVSELVYGDAKNQDELLIVKWGPGVGASVIIGGKVYEGASGRAAEIGHITVDKDGATCSCGRRGCLETVVSSKAIKKVVNESLAKGELTALKDLVYDNKFDLKKMKNWDWISLNDKELNDFIDSKIDTLALAVKNIACVLNPSNIIIFGSMFELYGFADRFVENYKKYDSFQEDDFIIKSAFGEKIYKIAPLSIVMDKLIFNKQTID